MDHPAMPLFFGALFWRKFIMRYPGYVFIAALIGLPMVSHASDPTPITRDQVRSELVQAELSGKIPQSRVHYPDAQPDPAVVYTARKAEESESYGHTSAGESASGAGSLHSRLASIVRPTVVDIYRGN